ncbi:hypothetical protein [Geothrix campi]|uniref:hypothetical protein n=1 Tax=Geothrix campi TaxID=2966450 RepID=UPI002147C9FF|nr:hypothetical protein [Geothrix sp. SG10]
MQQAEQLIGSEYRSFYDQQPASGRRYWEILYEDMLLVITKKGEHLLGFDITTRLAKWAYSAGRDQFITSLYVKNGRIWVGTFSCMHYELDFRTGLITDKEFLK